MNSSFNLLPDQMISIDLKKGYIHVPKFSGSILLKIFCKARCFFIGKPRVSILVNGKIVREQYFSSKINEEWYIDLTEINLTECRHYSDQVLNQPLDQDNSRTNNNHNLSQGTKVQIVPHFMKLGTTGTLLFFNNENREALSTGSNLIIAPHPDDGELACASIYGKNTYIAVLTAGQKLINLDKQYFDHMDDDLKTASKRKGLLRAFNAVTTPLLGGIPQDQCLCLGYLDATLSKFTNDDEDIAYDYASTPETFRIFNNKDFAKKCNLLKAPSNTRGNLKKEILSIINAVKPQRIFITNPFGDSHADHKAAGQIIFNLINDGSIKNADLYFYTLHAKKEKDLYFGPAGSFITLPYFQYENKIPDGITFKYASSLLNNEKLKTKTIMMNSMYDLYFAKDHRWYPHKTIPYFNSPRLGKAYYFNRFGKLNEVFLKVVKTTNEQNQNLDK